MGAVRWARGVRRASVVLLAWALISCASVPPHRYGVKSVDIQGMHELDPDALKACLNTTARDRASIDLGVHGKAECGTPPFDAWRKHWQLWTWGFTDWPLYDNLVFERDKERILRWYEARGYHHARVVRTVIQPAQAGTKDTIDPSTPSPGCKRVSGRQGCTVRVLIVVDQGEPTMVTDLTITGIRDLDRKLRRELRKQMQLARGVRVDEALYESSKQAMADLLRNHGYARVAVTGEVRVDRARRTAQLTIHVDTGPKCVFGRVHVEGAPSYMVDEIRAITLIDPGDPFSLETLKSAQRAVFSVGGFSTATAEVILPETGNVVDVRMRVEPSRRHRYGFGVGIQAGIVTRGDTWDPMSVPQWDVHVIAKYTQERVLRGLRRLTVEDRPAMIIQEQFPLAEVPRFGNELRAELRQYGLFEPRLVTVLSSTYVWGPDPYDTFFRHRVDTGLAFERFFLRNERLFLSAGLKNSVYRVPAGEVTMSGEPTPASSLLSYVFQRVRLDYRDDVHRTRQGFMAQAELQELGLSKLSSWYGFRTTPDARVYIPLPLYASLAFRFAVGMLFIRRADSELDELSKKLGPRDTRLRGGGATSNRGWLPGELGDGPDGGTRRWEGSAELRLRVTPNFGVVGFFDAGDVSKETKFRWNYPQASSGFGLRYHTIVGPIRLDFAWRLKGLQVFGTDQRDPGGEQSKLDFGFAKMAGAIHITIGESF